jgi:hypothetical protein
VGNILGTTSRVSGELFGATSGEMAKLSDPLRVMLDYLHTQQIDNPNSIVGFKWKPYYHNESYQRVWEWVAKHNVKVVYNSRNPLDIYISASKTHQVCMCLYICIGVCAGVCTGVCIGICIDTQWC